MRTDELNNALIADQQCRVEEVISPRSQQIILSGLVSISNALYGFIRTYVPIILPSPLARAWAYVMISIFPDSDEEYISDIQNLHERYERSTA